MNQPRNPATLHAPLGAYAHQIEVSGPQRWLVLSGQVGIRLDGSLLQEPADQFQVALDNIARNLQAADMAVKDLVKLTLYRVDPIDPARRREMLSAWLAGHAPCMTLLYVSALGTPALKVEIDAWACA
jgi:enamine deaminase RidA (YjgF/YER057c/UK114 family)